MSVISWNRLGLLLNIKLPPLINEYFILRSLQYMRAFDLQYENIYDEAEMVVSHTHRMFEGIKECSTCGLYKFKECMFYATYITPRWSRREVSQSHNVYRFVCTSEWKSCHKKRVALFQCALILNVMVFNKISNNISIVLIIFYNICFNRHMKFYQLVEELNNSLCI